METVGWTSRARGCVFLRVTFRTVVSRACNCQLRGNLNLAQVTVVLPRPWPLSRLLLLRFLFSAWAIMLRCWLVFLSHPDELAWPYSPDPVSVTPTPIQSPPPTLAGRNNFLRPWNRQKKKWIKQTMWLQPQSQPLGLSLLVDILSGEQSAIKNQHEKKFPLVSTLCLRFTSKYRHFPADSHTTRLAYPTYSSTWGQLRNRE